jgi:hypothetical protein
MFDVKVASLWYIHPTPVFINADSVALGASVITWFQGRPPSVRRGHGRVIAWHDLPGQLTCVVGSVV